MGFCFGAIFGLEGFLWFGGVFGLEVFFGLEGCFFVWRVFGLEGFLALMGFHSGCNFSLVNSSAHQCLEFLKKAETYLYFGS